MRICCPYLVRRSAGEQGAPNTTFVPLLPSDPEWPAAGRGARTVRRKQTVSDRNPFIGRPAEITGRCPD